MKSQEKLVHKGEIEYTAPFYHRIIDNFLPEDLFRTTYEHYQNCKFYKKHSDLFHFYQTDELKYDMRFQAFLQMVQSEMKKDLLNIKKEVCNEKMDLFGSFYEAGHYLLPHDDCVSERVLAFSFYLTSLNEKKADTTDTVGGLSSAKNAENKKEGDAGACSRKNGKLVLYQPDGKEIAKKVSVVANRLVIFEVSSKSFHEVEMMASGKRTALSGWMRSKEHNPKTISLDYAQNKYWFFHTEYVISCEQRQQPSIWRVHIENEEEYLQKAKKVLKSLQWKKRLNCLYTSLEEPQVPAEEEQIDIPLMLTAIEGITIDTLVGKIDKGGYLLLNDFFNQKSDFLVVLSLYSEAIHVIAESGEIAGTIKNPGYYVWQSLGFLHIPPGNSAGYVVAYRMNSISKKKKD